MPKATFVLKKPKSLEPTLVYLLFHFDNTKLKYSTSQKILPKYWNAERQRAKEVKTFTQSANFNFLLNKIETIVNDSYRKLITDGIVVTPELLRTLIDEALEKRAHSKDFIFFSEKVLEESDRKPTTKKAIRQTINILKEFKEVMNKPIYFDTIDLDFYNGFIEFLSSKNLRQSTIGNHIKNVKVFMREAFERGLTKNTQFQSKRFRKPFEESESIYLTIAEITTIYKLDLSHDKSLERVRDLFLVGCYTGLRFSDLTQLNKKNINRDKTFIKIKTQKTEEPVVIPINSSLNSIIEKYDGNFPICLSNQKMNDYLKEIGKLAGLDETIERVSTKGGKRIKEHFKKFELLSVHTARRSFATNAFIHKVPSIAIMKMTGHRTERTFLKYIKISQEDNAASLVAHPFFS